MDDVTLLLANAVEQTPGGLLSALGIGWSVTSSPTAPAALLMFVKVPWDQTNIRHDVVLDLITDDGSPARVEGTPIQITVEFETGRPAGVLPGTPIDWAQGIGLGSLPLEPGRYEWRMQIDRNEVAQRAFTVRRASGSAV